MAIGGGESAVIDDDHYLDEVATDLSGHRAIGAFDADGSAGCSGSPLVCRALWWTETYPAFYGTKLPVALGTDGTLYALTASGNIGAYTTLDTSSCDAGLPVVCHPVREFAIPDANVGHLAISGTTLYVEIDTEVYAYDVPGGAACSTASPPVCAPRFRTERDTLYGGDLVVAGGRIYQQTQQLAGNGAWGIEAFDAAGVDRCGPDGSSGGVVCRPVWVGRFNSSTVQASDHSTIVATPKAVYLTALYGFDPATSYVDAWDPTVSRNCAPGTGGPMVCYPIYRATGVRDPVAAGDIVLAVETATGDLQVFDAAGSADCSSFLQTCPVRATLGDVPAASAPLLPAIADGHVALHSSDLHTGAGLVQVFGL